MPLNPRFGPFPEDMVRFFAQSSVGEVFVASDELDDNQIAIIAEKHGYKVAHCSAEGQETKTYGPKTYKIIGVIPKFDVVLRVNKIKYEVIPTEYGKYIYIKIRLIRRNKNGN